MTTRAQLAHRFNGRATLGGVGFFDRPHGQTGVAPNGIELRPVLGEDVADQMTVRVFDTNDLVIEG